MTEDLVIASVFKGKRMNPLNRQGLQPPMLQMHGRLSDFILPDLARGRDLGNWQADGQTAVS